ncbi:ClpXP protease specificity-enhancing factor [Aliikangiella marina]|uniref:ClpXP protease specificity-enhancing factor n=1 Tax=Aliikangiella marina TaxID=1712262 RepID=A0A545T6J2_9GAMM|nr:ClpXP protease specificity-enhancing factor [Aliikangiella marina]TQV72847.1 ClpXP protease specificity-enhancing factor [Aliikangiella marina]
MQPEFTSNKPYLFRAILDWLLDNDATPYMLVDATRPGVEVPQEHIKDGQIVLNINPSAVQNWQVDNEIISFNARFSGVARLIIVPMSALLAIYAQENGLGMAFPAEEESEEEASSPSLGSVDSVEDGDGTDDPSKPENNSSPNKNNASSKKANHLKVVK